MKEIRLHGRGGQGAVTSAELIAQSAIRAGKFAQAFPSFGPERRGAPVMAYSRVSDSRIRNRSAIYEPDIVVVLDASLLDCVNVTAGLKDDGLVVLNTALSPEEVRVKYGIKHRIAVVDALAIANEILKRPITNTTMLGALNKAGVIEENEQFFACIDDRFGKIAAKNKAAFQKAYDTTKILEKA